MTKDQALTVLSARKKLDSLTGLQVEFVQSLPDTIELLTSVPLSPMQLEWLHSFRRKPRPVKR